MSIKKSKRQTAGAVGLTEAVFGYDTSGNVRFYLADEGKAWRANPDAFVQAHSSRCTRFDPGHRPILALVREGEGLWFDDAWEWVESQARPNAWVAFTAEDARRLIERAGVGDKLVALGTTNLAAIVGDGGA
jgi:hypothetical protein